MYTVADEYELVVVVSSGHILKVPNKQLVPEIRAKWQSSPGAR